MNLQSSIPTTIRQHLQIATTGQHRALDGAFVSLALQNASDYRRFLMAQAAVVAPLEDWLTRRGLANMLPDWASRQRAEALAEDLAALNSPPEYDAVAIDAPSSASLLGIAYVLEGSRLGAQYLARVVSASPDPVVRDNMRFLEHGTGLRLWPTFLQILEANVDTPQAAEDAAAGARHAFDLFLTAQQRHAPVPVKATP